MNKPVKIAEERFTDARELGHKLVLIMESLSVYLGRGPKDATPVTYVTLFEPEYQVAEGEARYASIVRLWEETLTDGSKVYEVHIL